MCFPLGTSLSSLRTWDSIRTWTHDIHHVFELSEEFISAGMKKEFDNLQYVLRNHTLDFETRIAALIFVIQREELQICIKNWSHAFWGT